METVNIHYAKTHLSRLIEAVLKGEEVIIAKSGEPKVKLVPFTKKKTKRKGGQLKGKIWLADDWNSDKTNKEIADLFYKSAISDE
jgi:prevent-host-death family protein